MLSTMRNSLSKVVVGTVIGLIALVFVFYGVFNPRRTQGMHEGAVAGMVNGDVITRQEFARELNQRMEFFKALGGGQISEAQIKAFHVKEGVFQELVRRKLMIQAAIDQGYSPSDDQLKESIMKAPYFQKDGKFDRVTYEGILKANNLSPGIFEKMERENLALRNFEEAMKSRVQVTDNELKVEYLASREKRNFRFVLVRTEDLKRDMKVSDADAQAYLADGPKLNLMKSHFDARKDSEYKGKKFDDVKTEIAREMVLTDKMPELAKKAEGLATAVKGALTKDAKSDAKVKAAVAPYSFAAKSSGLIARGSQYIPGAGDAKEAIADGFSGKLKDQPQVYRVAEGFLVALVTESQSPDWNKFDSEKDTMRSGLQATKERSLMSDLIQTRYAKAKIEKNDTIVGDEADTGAVE